MISNKKGGIKKIVEEGSDSDGISSSEIAITDNENVIEVETT